MLESILHKICKQSDRYGTQLWMHRISGNRADVCTKFTNEKDPVQFHHAVIHIGQVLQAIHTMATENGYKTRIQSFPSLDEKHLVAILRLKEEDNKDSKKGKIIFEPGQSTLTNLDILASRYGMCVRQIPVKSLNSYLNFDLRMVLSDLSFDSSKKQYLVLCSKSKNPFVWLDTGYWKEQILQWKEVNTSTTGIEFVSLPHQVIMSKMNSPIDENPYPQLLILV